MIEIRNFTEILQHLSGLKAVVFDLDDTLYSEKEYVKSGYAAVAHVLPNVENAEAKLWKAFEENKSAIDYVLLSENIYSENLKQKCLETYRFHKPNIHLYDKVEETLIFLHESGFLIGIITDGRPEGQRAKIKALGLNKLVDYIIITDELGGTQFRKPCNIAFRIMQRRWGLPFEQIIYVGDNPTKDFQACRQLGMRWIYFRNENGLYSNTLIE